MTDSTSGPDNASDDDSSEQEVILEVACNVSDKLEEAIGLGEEDLLRVALLTLERVRVSESVEISVLVTDDEGLHELNRDFRGKDETTDVLSFPLLAVPLVEAPADELWQPDEEDNDDDAAQLEQWPDSADHGAASLTDSDDDDDESDTDDASDGGSDDYDEDDEEPLHLGDIAISRDAVVRQAAAAGHSISWECAYLFAHGLLHLMGYDDSTDAGYRAMVAHQEAVLTEAHITR
ncbi:MAG TPA: rRNA maturation RNase YbeY [Ktedonobacterales bacterium]|nr:rRNA maturation RNase YbeY [Ktedonobacterales bacterium]